MNKTHKILPASEIHRKYYADVSVDDFKQIVSTDPISSNLQKEKLGKYAKWMLHLYRKKQLKLEDLYKAQEYLPAFDKAVATNKLQIKDINRYRSLAEMYAVVKPFLNSQLVSKREQLRAVKQNEAEKMYEDDVFVVIHPLTEAASCLYGKGTQWCTASKGCSAFEDYNSQGKLYIIIDKQSGKKYQFHAESNSYMDETDMPIDMLEDIGATDGLLDFCRREFLDPLMEYSHPLVLGDKRLYIVEKQDKYGVITSDNKKLLDFEFDEIKSYMTCYLLVRNGNHKRIYNVETDNLMEYSLALVLGDKRIYIVKKQDKYGVVTSDNKKLLDFEFDEIKSYTTGLLVRNGNHKGIYNVATDGIKWGYVGNTDLVKVGDTGGVYHFPNFSGGIFDEKIPYFLHYLKNVYLALKKHNFTADHLIVNPYTLRLLNQCCGVRQKEVFFMTFYSNGEPFKMCLSGVLHSIFEMYPIIDERLSNNVFLLCKSYEDYLIDSEEAYPF